jgi:hypothetical protein
VTANGLSKTGADAVNYTFPGTGAGTADITAKTIAGAFTADNKVYDGNTSATVLTRTLTGVIGTDDVSFSGGTATFATPTVGNGKTVTLTGAGLTGTLAGNYTLGGVTSWTTTANITTACSVFNGFLSPVGGAVEKGNGGTFADPVRAFKLNSTIPLKFTATCSGVPLTTGVHTLQMIKYSNSTTPDAAIDATPTDGATTGNEFRLIGTEWHYNLATKSMGTGGQGIWLFKATLFDGSTYTVWIEIKK